IAAGSNCTATIDLRSSVMAQDNSAAPVTIMQSPSPTTPLGLGATTLTFVGVDAAGNQSEPCTTVVTFLDRTPPTIVGVTPSLTQLWPPNQVLVPITVEVSVSDNCSSSVQSEIIS